MNDTQIAPASADSRIFLVSPILHCVSMTVLVYLRSSFGFAFLRPRSIFFAFSWAFILYGIYAWISGDVWREQHSLLWFGLGAITLYWLHLLHVIIREWRQSAGHDAYAGTPHLIAVLRLCGKPPSASFDSHWRLWGEPSVVVLAAFVCGLILGERHLSFWLLLAGSCLWAKEVLNQWFHIRKGKRLRDIAGDAEEAFDAQPNNRSIPEPPAVNTRRAKIHRKRADAPSSGTDEEIRHAEVLQLLPPYDLALVEHNYHALVKSIHPDTNSAIEVSNGRTRALNEAVKYFRDRSHS